MRRSVTCLKQNLVLQCYRYHQEISIILALIVTRLVRVTLVQCYHVLGLLRTSTSSPSWIFETLVPVPKVVEDVLVFVHGILGW